MIFSLAHVAHNFHSLYQKNLKLCHRGKEGRGWGGGWGGGNPYYQKITLLFKSTLLTSYIPINKTIHTIKV